MLAVPGRYCVTYLLLSHDAVGIVDVGSAADIERILAVLHWLGRPWKQIRWILPTHLHFDHMMGIDPLARKLGTQVRLGRVAHQIVNEGREPRWPPRHQLLRAAVTWVLQGMPVLPPEDWRDGLDFGVPWGQNRFTAPVGAPLDDGGDLPGMEGWKLIQTPGHSDDGVCLHHDGAGFLITGDTIRNFLGGEWNHLLSERTDFEVTRSRLSRLRVSTILPAHGPIVESKGGLAGLRSLPWYLP